MTAAVTVDLAGGQWGGVARHRAELTGYLQRRIRPDVKVIGAHRQLSPAWLAAREATAGRRGRRIALNNVGFLTPGGQRWTLLANALHFPTNAEQAALEPGLRTTMARQAAIVHRAARRSDVLIAPCTTMAERIAATLPDAARRLVVRLHPVSPASAGLRDDGRGGDNDSSLILCPVLFAPYKRMAERLADWLAAVGDTLDDSVRLLITANPAEVPPSVAASPRLHFVGRLSLDQVQALWARATAVYYPTSVESFGYPLAEAQVNGLPVIALDTAQNREIAGPALCGYHRDDLESLRDATVEALAKQVVPHAAPFDADAYFDWLLGGNP